MKKTTISTILLFLTASLAFGQIDSINVDVYRSYRPELANAQKITSRPSLPPPNVGTKPIMVYRTNVKKLNTDFDPPAIKALNAAKPKSPKEKAFYAKLGYGNFNSPLANIHLNSTGKNDFNYGLSFMHLSSKSDISTRQKEFKDAAWSETAGALDLSYNLIKSVAYGAVNIGSSGRRLYGYNSNDTSFAELALKQNLYSNSLKLGIRNSALDLEEINYDFSFGFNQSSKNKWFSQFDPRESEFKFSADLHKGIGDHVLGLFAGLNTSTYTGISDSVELNRTMLFFNPSFKLNMDEFKADIGFNLVNENTSSQDSSVLHVYPNVSASYTILDPDLTVFAGVRGELQQNNLVSLFGQNSFLRLENMDIRNTSQGWEAFGGAKGNVLGMINYKINIGYGNYQNHLFFIPDTIDTRRHLTSYSSDVGVFRIIPEISFKYKHLVQANLSYTFKSFNFDDKDFESWGQPTSVLNLNIASQPIDKLGINFDIYSYGGIKYQSIEEGNGTKTLDPIFDISLGANYSINENFGLFVETSNLSSSNYRRWVDYPSYGLGVIGGISLSF